ncbi:MAG: hypothetical protein JXA07_14525 [Spirochaetes bacterium]|nr:hypothetical protein [Spirochaetota bacterium]
MNFNTTSESGTGSSSMFDYVCSALLLGAVWGFFEVFFKDVLAMGGKPYTAALTSGIGVMIMAAGYALFRRAWIAPMIALFSIAARMIVVPVLGCSPMCRANAVVALALLGLFSGAAFYASSKTKKHIFLTGGLSVGTGTLLSGISFYYAGLACAPCQYLSNFQAIGGLSSFIAMEVVYWIAFTVILFYPGYGAGMWIASAVESVKKSRPVPYYAGMLCGSFILILLTGLILAQ